MSGSTTVTVLDPMMKVLAEEPLFNNIFADSDLMNLVEVDDRVAEDATTGGRYIERAHITGPPTGFGARREGDYMPEAQDPTSVNSRIYLRSMYGRIQMTGHTMRRVVGDQGSFINWAQDAFEYFSKYTAAPEIDRILCGYGAAVKARCNGTPSLVSGSTYDIVLKDSFGVSGWGDAWLTLVENENLVFGAAATTVAASLRNAGTAQAFTVTDINEATNTVRGTMAAGLAAAIVDSDYIFPGDAAGFSGAESGQAREPVGFLGAVDDGGILATYLNITRSTAGRKFKAHTLDVGSGSFGFGGTFSEDAMAYGDDLVKKSQGGEIDWILASTNANRSYWKSQKSNVVFSNTMAAVGSGQNGKPSPLSIRLGSRTVNLKVIRKLPPSIALGITKSTFKLFTLKKWNWSDITGAIWRPVVTTSGVKDEYYCIGFTDFELANHYPRLNIRFEGISSVY